MKKISLRLGRSVVLPSLILVLGFTLLSLLKSPKAYAGPLNPMPAWCTPGVPSASATHCAGRNITLTDGGGNFQSRWAGQYLARTTAPDYWLVYCLRDDLSHPDNSVGSVIMPDLIPKGGGTTSLPAKYAYVMWKWGDSNDDDRAAAVWMLGHFYAQDVTDSDNVIVPNLSASANGTVNALAQAMDAEANIYYGSWTFTYNLNTPVNWNGSSTPGTVTLRSATSAVIANQTVTLSAINGSVSPTTVTTDVNGVANFSYTGTPGTTVTISASVDQPATQVILNPPGVGDQYVGTSGGAQVLSANSTANAVKRIDLTINKKLLTVAPFKRGQAIQYSITAHNNGPDDAIAGWSITDLMPDGLVFGETNPAVDSDSGFSCGSSASIGGGTKMTCTSSQHLASGADIVLIVNARISESAPANASLRNLAFISPASGETAETNVLAEPTFSTADTAGTTTNNDTEASLSLGVATAPNSGFANQARNMVLPIIVILIGALVLLQPKIMSLRK